MLFATVLILAAFKTIGVASVLPGPARDPRQTNGRRVPTLEELLAQNNQTDLLTLQERMEEPDFCEDHSRLVLFGSNVTYNEDDVPTNVDRLGVSDLFHNAVTTRNQEKVESISRQCPALKSEILNGAWFPSGETALYSAAREGNFQLVLALLDQPHVDVNKGSAKRWTPLMGAVRSIHSSYGLRPSRPGDAGVSKAKRLHGVGGAGREIVQLLVADPRVDVNVQNKYGDTALQIASFWADQETVKVLLRCPKTSIGLRGWRNVTALEMAQQKAENEYTREAQREAYMGIVKVLEFRSDITQRDHPCMGLSHSVRVDVMPYLYVLSTCTLFVLQAWDTEHMYLFISWFKV